MDVGPIVVILGQGQQAGLVQVTPEELEGRVGPCVDLERGRSVEEGTGLGLVPHQLRGEVAQDHGTD